MASVWTNWFALTTRQQRVSRVTRRTWFATGLALQGTIVYRGSRADRRTWTACPGAVLQPIELDFLVCRTPGAGIESATVPTAPVVPWGPTWNNRSRPGAVRQPRLWGRTDDQEAVVRGCAGHGARLTARPG